MRTPHPPQPGRFLPFYILPGARVGTYVVRHAIGGGGGQVAYLATDPDGREVVLKICRFPRGARGSRESAMHERFLRQVTFFLQLRGIPGVAHVFAHDMIPDTSDSGHPYMVQEWIQGSINILDWYRGKPHPLKAIIGGFTILASACGEMDRRGICNRDLKPSNILVAPVGHGIPKIVDFDSGMSVGAAQITSTGPGRWPGTKLYYSPEMCKAILADWAARRRTPFQYRPAGDLHALGLILYEALTGKHPFDEGESDEELFQQIACQAPERPSALNPEVPFGLDKIAMRLLQKDPVLRYQSGDDLAEELQVLLETKDEWDRPFQTPAKGRHSTSSSRPSSTRTASPPLTPRACSSNGSAALNLAPSAIVLAGSHALVRWEPAPSALVRPVPQPRVRPPVPRRWPRLLMAVVASVLVAVVVWLLLGQRGASGSYFQRETMAFSKTKAVIAAVVSSAVTACTGIFSNLRAGDRDFLAQCPPEARKVVADLELPLDTGLAEILDGPNIFVPFTGGVEVRDGPVTVSAIFSTPNGSVVGRLFGEIRTDSKGASLRFTRIRVRNGSEAQHEAPAGPEYDVCAVASTRSRVKSYEDYGIPKAENPRRPQDLHPGFLFVTTGALRIHFPH